MRKRSSWPGFHKSNDADSDLHYCNITLPAYHAHKFMLALELMRRAVASTFPVWKWKSQLLHSRYEVMN
jgi:hypothetical protein